MSVSNKGFIITIDSFVSVTLMLFIIVASFFYLSQVSLTSWNSVALRNAVFSELAVLEKDSILERAVVQSSSEELLSALDLSPQNYCFEVVVFDENVSSPLVHALKTGCVKTAKETVSAERTFVVVENESASFYVARGIGWLE
jgi:hypothetical protein